MKLFGKKKKETDPAVLEKYMAEVCGKMLAEKLIGQIDIKMAQQPTENNQQQTVDKPIVTKSFVSDVYVKPITLVSEDLSIDNIKKPKRKYTKRNKEF